MLNYRLSYRYRPWEVGNTRTLLVPKSCAIADRFCIHMKNVKPTQRTLSVIKYRSVCFISINHFPFPSRSRRLHCDLLMCDTCSPASKIYQEYYLFIIPKNLLRWCLWVIVPAVWVFVDEGLSNGRTYELRVSASVICQTYSWSWDLLWLFTVDFMKCSQTLRIHAFCEIIVFLSHLDKWYIWSRSPSTVVQCITADTKRNCASNICTSSIYDPSPTAYEMVAAGRYMSQRSQSPTLL